MVFHLKNGHGDRDKKRDSMDRADSHISFGSWVRARRKQLDLTQAELGKRASCSEATVRKIEADERKPSRQLAELLSRALAISPEESRRFLLFARGGWLESQESGEDASSPSPHNLPALMTSTIDRVHDHAAITALIRDRAIRLVTILGPPGIGKTRLSIHCGSDLLDDFPDGVWFVDLSEVRSPEFFAAEVARSLAGIDLPPSPDLDRLIHGLKSRRLLLILDNFEQIVDGAAMEVAQILKKCPQVKLLATSRLPLHLYGESEYPLPPLSIPPSDAPQTEADLLCYESVQLFVARIRLHQPRFSITAQNASAVMQICSILDGIPLALELAAATLQRIALDEMNDLLRGRNWTGQLSTPARDLPHRQRTLENVIEWSYWLLSAEEQQFYARLGVLSGWFDAGAAAAMGQTDHASAVEHLARLADHSLLVRERIAGRTYWRMLEIIHAHAYSKLPQPDAIEMLRARYYVSRMKALAPGASPAEQEAFYASRLPNLHGALSWAITSGNLDLALELVFELNDDWSSLGYFREGLEFCRRILRLENGLRPKDRSRLLHIASDLAWQQHDFETAQNYLQQHIELAKAPGFTGETALHLNRLGRILIEQGRLEGAKAALREARELAFHESSALNPGFPLAQLGEIALFEGDLEEAGLLLRQALAHLTPRDDIFLAMVKTDLAEIALAGGDPVRARDWLGEGLEPARNHIRRFIVLLCALAGCLVLAPAGGAERAGQIFGAIENLSERSGLPLGAFYQRLNQQRTQIARRALSGSAWQAAFSAGQAWDKETAVRQAAEALCFMGSHIIGPAPQ